MGSTYLNGKQLAKTIKDELKKDVHELKEIGIVPKLAVIIVGEDPASQVYVRNKKRACDYIGIESLSYELPQQTSHAELLALVQSLNADDSVHGILVQLPLPQEMNEDDIIESIHPSKDVDGFHPINVGRLSIGRPEFISCTPYGIMEMLRRYDIEIEGKHCVVVGRSNIVGKPISQLLLAANGTVTTCHSRTKNLKEICQDADILVAAIGKAKFITAEYVKEGAVVIDVGMNRLEDKTLCGDVDTDAVGAIASFITPVPGGVGPMTIAMLMKNVVQSAKQ